MSNSPALALSEEFDFERYFIEHNLPEEAREYIRRSVKEPPALLIGESKGTNRPNNFIIEFSNTKAHTSETLESTEERAHAYLLDQSDTVPYYISRPEPIRLKKLDKNKVARTTDYQPDFLELAESGPVVVETKPEDGLEECRGRHPHNWDLNEEEYRHLPIERHYNHIGLGFRVVNTSKYSRTLVENLQLIRQVHRHGVADFATQRKVLALLREESVMNVEDVLDAIGAQDTTQILFLINSRQLYAAIDRQRLSKTSHFFVTLPSNGDELETLLKGFAADTSGTNVCLALGSPCQVARAINKLELVELSWRGANSAEESLLLKLKERSIRRYKEAIREGKRQGKSKIESLFDKHHKKGNRKPKRVAIVLDALRKLCVRFYSSPTRRDGAAAYRRYHLEASKIHPEEDPVSYPRFLEELQSLFSDEAVQYARGGKRLANASQGPTDPTKRQLKPSRAFERAACDHYQVDSFFLVNEANLEITVRPWITLIRDLYTGIALAVYVDLAPPSRMSVAAALRACIRNYGRVPECLIVDGGADFESTYFTQLCYELDIEIHRRPKGHPKYGSEAERFFGEVRTELLSQMEGNFVRKIESRSISGNKSSKNVASYTLRRFIELIEVHRVWRKDDYIRTDLASPSILLEDSLKRFPMSGNPAELDKKMRVLTSVQSKDIKFHPIRGIKILDDHYWSTKLDAKRFRPSVDSVRIDPENGFVIYVHVDGAWVDCYSENNEGYRYLPLEERIYLGILTRHQQRLRRKPQLLAHHKLIDEITKVNIPEAPVLNVVKPTVAEITHPAPRKIRPKVLQLKRRPS